MNIPKTRSCLKRGCKDKHLVRGLCNKHRQELQRRRKGSFVRGSKEHKIMRSKIAKDGKWIPPSRKGAKLPLKTRLRLREIMLKRVSEGLHNNYKGGITSINAKIRDSLDYKLWREAVYKRDGFKCVWCGNGKSGILNADHIKPFSLYPELRFAIDNGRTLCLECHKKTSSYLNSKMKKDDY